MFFYLFVFFFETSRVEMKSAEKQRRSQESKRSKERLLNMFVENTKESENYEFRSSRKNSTYKQRLITTVSTEFVFLTGLY